MNTTYFLNLIAGNIFGSKKTPAIPSAYFIGMSSSEPSIDGNGVTEPSGGGYKRVKLTGLSTPADGVITNETVILFDESTADWGVMTHFVVYDALTGGNLLMYDRLPAQRTVEAETVMSIKAGAVRLSVINPTA